MCKILNREVQRFGKGLDERTTAGRACFVKLYTVYRLVLDLDAFHILTTDIQDTVYIRFKERCSIIMGYGLNFTLVQHQSGFDQSFTISGRAGVDDFHIFRKSGINILDCGNGST